jgi:hypothetical protein
MGDLTADILKELGKYILTGITPDQKLYHYTNAENLISMVGSNELRVTNAKFMNDTLEADFADGILREVLKGVDLRPYSLEFFTDDIMGRRQALRDKTYILSLSKSDDSLHLWNSYGKNDGYNVGFRYQDLAATMMRDVRPFHGGQFHPSFRIFGNVIYDRDAQAELIRFGARKYIELSNVAIDDYKRSGGVGGAKTFGRLFQIFIALTCLFKQAEHRVEDEFRVVVICPQDTNIASYRVRDGIIVPYLTMKPRTGLLPIESVRIGPKIDDEVAELGVRHLCGQNYPQVDISRSRIKLRF